LANPVYAGKTLVFTPHLAAGFGNPAEHHGNSQRAEKLETDMALTIKLHSRLKN
jgi:hypothetical protein